MYSKTFVENTRKFFPHPEFFHWFNVIKLIQFLDVHSVFYVFLISIRIFSLFCSILASCFLFYSSRVSILNSDLCQFYSLACYSFFLLFIHLLASTCLINVYSTHWYWMFLCLDFIVNQISLFELKSFNGVFV